jgi:(E)-4-hydroxy-3-methylbut-2-enyl-diphosphate synthase
MNDLGADFIYSGKNQIDFMLPNGLKEILDFEAWENHPDQKNKIPLFDIHNYKNVSANNLVQFFVKIKTGEIDSDLLSFLENSNQAILILESERPNAYPDFRVVYNKIYDLKTPVILSKKYTNVSDEDLQLFAATDLGGCFIDGFGDGIMISAENKTVANSLAFGILQAARTRMSKTEYISCPSCGRTLFDLQETTAMIRKRTDHLKGIKIGIMGCIVNGPGEMADADYGYVGIGKDKISLYRGQEVVKRSVNSQNAVEELIELIKEDGNWIEPSAENELLKTL